MYDLQKIGKLITDIEKYLKEIEGYALTKENLKDSKTYHASSMLIFSIVKNSRTKVRSVPSSS